MLGLGLGLTKGGFIFTFAKSLYRKYVARVTAAGGVQQNAACDIATLTELNSDGLLKQASLVLVPDGIEEDIVFAQVPTSGLGDLTFTRASDATYTDASGVVRRSPYNLATSSSDFSQVFQLLNSTITTNTITDPFGTLLGDSLLETIATDVHAGYNDYTVLVDSQYTYSVYVKSIGGRDVRVSGSSGFGGSTAIVNLSNGAILSSTGTIQVSAAGNGWYRISITATTTTTTARILIYSAIGTTTTFAGDVTKGVYLFGRQFVEGNQALDYFPTTDRLNVPRIDFRNADGTLSSCGRLLLEPQRTNLVPNGLSYNSSTGVAYNTAVSGSPMAGVNCARITKNEAAGTIRYGNQFCSASVLAGSTGYVLSAFFKYDGVDFATSMEYNNAVQWGNVTWSQPINIASTGITIGVGTFCTSTVENWGNGWYRVNVRITTGTTPSSSPVSYLMRLPSTLSTGQGFLHALPQLELGTYPTTYIPTTTAAVTRLADVANKTGVSSLIGQTEGTLFAEVNWGIKPETGSPIVSILTLNNNVTNIQNAIILGIERASAGTNRIYCLVNVSNVTQAALFGSTITSGNYKIAFAYKQNDFVLYVNGAQIATDPSGNVPTTSQILLGQRINGDTFVMADGIAQAALFTTRLTNDQLEVLTSEGYGNYALLAQSLNYVLQ